MSTLVVLKESNVLVLGTDSRIMKPDCSGIASDSGKKIVEIAEQTFIAASGWQFGCDFGQAKARELASKLGTTNIQMIGNALWRELGPYLEELVKESTSVEGLHTYGGQEVCGNVPIHSTVLVGRDARGKLGHVTQEYSLCEGGGIAINLSEYFGDKRQIWVRPGEPVIHVAQDSRTWTDSPVVVVRRFLTALKEANSRIGGPDQIVELDRYGVHWLSQLPALGAESLSVAGNTHATVNVGSGGMTFTNGSASTVILGNQISTASVVSVVVGANQFNTPGGVGWTGTVPVGARPIVSGGIVVGYTM